MGWLIILAAYIIIGFLVGTFLFAFAKIRFNPDFSRRNTWGDRASWRNQEMATFCAGISGLIWPLLLPVIVGYFAWKCVVPIFTGIINFWEYVIKEVINPRENV